MNKLLEFVDRLCIDERLYWRVPRKGGGDEVEISWERQGRPEPWRVRPLGTSEWTTLKAADLWAGLEAVDADEAAFERQLGASILTQAVFADLVLEGAIDLFGDAVVSRSIRDTKAFLSSVSETAAEMTKVAGNGGRKLRIVTSGGRT